ncbi:hypothetical protein RZS28_01145 [Methylocapsa polymorpha]|uniref:Uncharacterized protein n=1 Tax=Methylocapsa polymorpha TaxID=3080828 RepID=A0ABZ0HSQ9_9HYPH|nr:hypothetical protein RZS28_01145 [Methylocapsa sp. RX1]
MPAQHQFAGLRRALLRVAEAVVIVYVVLDGIITPIFRPVLRWTAQLRLILSLQDFVRRLPPYAILVFFLVPHAVIEPAKIYAVYLIGSGHPLIGLITLALTYLIGLVVVERIYNAGKEKLRTIAWFAKILDWLFDFRDRLIAWARSTEVWAFAVKTKRWAADVIRQARLRVGAWLTSKFG